MLDAVARVGWLPTADVRLASMLAGDASAVAQAALANGAEGLARIRPKCSG
jgi:hypothetical protein